MKIALILEKSQISKMDILLKILKNLPFKKKIFNINEEKKNIYNFIHVGIISSLLINTKSVDYIITGCSTGQSMLMSLNIHPGLFCGYCDNIIDAFLFNKINNINAISLSLNKGFGLGSLIKLKTILEILFNNKNKGVGYPKNQQINTIEQYLQLNKLKFDIINNNLFKYYNNLNKLIFYQCIDNKNFLKCILKNSKNKLLSKLIYNKINIKKYIN